MQIRAALSLPERQDVVIEAIELDEALRPDELRVRLVATGICHTDLKQLRLSSAVPRPVVLGHEGAGIVEAVGSGAQGFDVGDSVVMSVNSCGQCPSCMRHLPGYCVQVGPRNFGGARPDGTSALSSLSRPRIFGQFFGQSSFATHAICNVRNAVKVDASGLSLASLAPLGCGVQTGAGSVLNEFKLRPGQSLVVFGAGAVGLCAVMAARLSGATAVIAVDRVDSRLDLALSLGATSALRADQADLVRAISAATGGGADFALDTTGVPAVIDQALAALAPQGVCGLLASPSDKELRFAASPLILGGHRIQGIVQGSSDPKQFIPRMLALHRAGQLPFDRLVRYYPFEAINEAIEHAHAGTTIKPVLTFAG